MNLQPGLRISESVELRSLIGHGGMGQVWAATQGLLLRDVAVKFLCESIALDIDAQQRFLLEAQTLARLHCKHIPQVFDFGTMPDGSPFIVMELLEGSDLEKRLELGGPLSPAQTAELMRQMAYVLSLAHRLGFVHRDIKPGNIVLLDSDTGELTAKLLDFGLTKRASAADSGGLTRTGITLGTPSYMSPEQLLSAKQVDSGADLWSLAVVAYRCLTGALPFSGETFAAVFLSIERDGFTKPTALRPGLPASLDAWFDKALNRNPEERFISATGMAEAFDEAIEGAFEGRPAAIASPDVSDGSASHARARSKAQKRLGGATARAVGVASLVAFAASVLAAHGSFGPDWSFDWLSMHHQATAWLDSCAHWATSLVH